MEHELQNEIKRLRTESREIAFVAMCVWEHLDHPARNLSLYAKKREEIGTVAFRYLILDNIAPAIEFGYRAQNGSTEYDAPFDWEYIPEFLDELETVIEEIGWNLTAQQSVKIALKLIGKKHPRPPRERSDRYYGFVEGDRVRETFNGIEREGVICYLGTDNNGGEMKCDDGRIAKIVLEWCTLIDQAH